MHILLTGAGAAGAVSIIKALRNGLPKARITAADADPLSVGASFADQFYTIPPAHEPHYIEELANLCSQAKFDVAIISVDEEIEVLVREKKRFAAIGTNLALADAEGVLTCLDKSALYEFFQKTDILIPATSLLKNYEYQEGLRLVLKPRRGRGSNGIYYVFSSIDMDYYKQVLPPDDYLVQEMVTGNEYTVDVLRNRDGDFLATVPRLRMATDSGLSVKGKTVRDERVIHLTQQVITALGLYGAANVQWMVPEKGDARLIEVNPRLAGTSTLSVAAGVNIPTELVKLFGLKDYKGKKMDFIEGVLMLRFWEAQFSYPPERS